MNKRLLLVVLIWIQFLSVSSYSLDNRGQIWIPKCCTKGDAFNVDSNSCILNTNQVKFEADTVILNKGESKWIVESNSVRHAFRYDALCSGNITRNYRVTQTGALIEYTGEKSYYQFYNKYCVDVDHKTGEKIAIICDDKLVVKKCCNLTSILIDRGENTFQCQPTENVIYLNDLSESIFGDEEKKNSEFEFEVKDHLMNYKAIKEFGMRNFEFDEDQKMFKFDNKTDFCLDKLISQWIVLVENEETIMSSLSIAIIILFVLSVIVMSLLMCFKHKLFVKNPRNVS
jgi:hypothetical protein